MIVEDVNMETIKVFLKELPKGKEFCTPSIEIARGKFKYKNTWLNRIKRLING